MKRFINAVSVALVVGVLSVMAPARAEALGPGIFIAGASYVYLLKESYALGVYISKQWD